MKDIEDVNDMHMEVGFEDVSAVNDKSQTPLFCGSPQSRLDETLLLMNVFCTYKATNACISEMLH